MNAADEQPANAMFTDADHADAGEVAAERCDDEQASEPLQLQEIQR